MKTQIVIAALALALTACGTTAPNTVTSNPPPAEIATETPTPTPTTRSVAAFGETVTFPNGLAITTTTAIRTAGQYASGAVDGKIVVVKVAAKNTSAALINASLETWPEVTYGDQGLRAPSASDEGLMFGSIGNLLPGETETVMHGYGIPAAGMGALRVEFTSMEYGTQPAVFKGAAG